MSSKHTTATVAKAAPERTQHAPRPISQNLLPQPAPAEIVQRVASDPGSLIPGQVLRLQRAIGNRRVTRLLHDARTSSAPKQAIQRKKVDTGFGTFETTKFNPAEDRGVEIDLYFRPDETKVDAKKIALSQSVRKASAAGAYALDPTQAGRMVKSGKPGAGYAIDQLSDINSPIYTSNANLKATEGLEATPFGDTGSGDMGYCYKEKPADTKKKKKAARLSDRPLAPKEKGQSKTFETTALAVEGADKDKYYGSVKWGLKIEGTSSTPTLTVSDIELASAPAGTPTENFVEAAKEWNKSKTRGALQVTANPATVLKGDGSGTETLAKDTKLSQLDTVAWGADPALQAEVLDNAGKATGKIVYIKNVDVIDTGAGGVANKPLPIP